MTRKTLLYILIFSFVFSLAFVFFPLESYMMINMKNPYDLSDNYITVQVNMTLRAIDNQNRQEDASVLTEKLYTILKDKKITMIYFDLNTPGLGLYDARHHYTTDMLIEGTMFTAGREPAVIVQNDSYTFEKVVRKEGKRELKFNHGKNISFKITGVYDETHPLHSVHKLEPNDYEFIYNFFGISDNNMSGLYLLDADSRSVVDDVAQEMVKLFRSHNLVADVFDKGQEKSGVGKVLDKLMDRIFSSSVLITGLMLVIFNLPLIYLMLFIDEKKIMYVHAIFGATKSDIFIQYSKKVILTFFISSVSALLIFWKLLFDDANVLTLYASTIIVMINVLVGYGLWALAFFIGRHYKQPGW